jgi:hypothetical protein
VSSAIPPRHVLALLDDAALAREVIEMSSILARQLQRPLEVIYVESAPALLAAALPFAQVLAHGATQWAPFAPEDVERGYRAQAQRLRELAERLLTHQTVTWSMRVVRGALQQIALELQSQSDLVVIARAAGAAALPTLRRPQRARRPIVTAVVDDSAAGQTAREVAQQVAKALGGMLLVRQTAGAGITPALVGRCDLLVVPRSLVQAGDLTRLEQPALLVG